MEDGRLPASDRKRKVLRDQGDLPSPGELGHLSRGLLLVASVGLWMPFAGRRVGELARRVFSDPMGFDPAGLVPLATEVGLATLAVLALAVLLGAGLQWAVLGWLWAPARLGPVPGRLPGFDASRAGWALLVSVVAAGLGTLALVPSLSEVANATSFGRSLTASRRLVVEGLGAGALAAALLGIVGYLGERRRYEERIAMTVEERRREAIEELGNPVVRARIRELSERSAGGAAGPGGAPREPVATLRGPGDGMAA